MSIAAPPLMTTEEFLAIPDDGIERWLIRGQLREAKLGDATVTVRNRWHSRIMARVATILNIWLDSQPKPRGEILCGEAGCRLRRNPDTTVGIDVVYISPNVAGQQSAKSTLIEGIPTLIVEILSPSDTQQQIDEKVDDYLEAGVAHVWVIDPHDRTVLVYRPKAEPHLVNVGQELSAEPDLPGFQVAVADLFA